jgi:hypothetical protein
MSGAAREDAACSAGPPLTIPCEKTLWTTIKWHVMANSMITVGSPYLLYQAVMKWSIVKDTWTKASRPSIRNDSDFKSSDLIRRLWLTEVGKLFYHAVEYQKMEGFCGPATQRCLLKSIPGIKSEEIPPQVRGPSTVSKFAEVIGSIGDKAGITKTKVVLASEGYEAFLDVLRKSNSPKFRVAANFLRSPLFGFVKPSFLPINTVLTFMGGHFSPILGYFERENLVAVFDVNHTYGLWFVQPERLYSAIYTFDITSGLERGLVLVEIL